MNIGIVTTWFERGAAYVSRHYRQVLAAQHAVHIYARGGQYALADPVWDQPYVTWAKIVPGKTFTPVDLADFARWLRNKHIDVVFFNEQHWWEPVLLANSMGIKTGAYIDYYTEKTIPLFGCYDFLICNTKRHFSAFDWHEQCYFVPWGTDTNLFRPKSFDTVEKGKVVFFHSAGMSPERKGTDALLRAFNLLDEPKAKLVIHAQRSLKECFSDVSKLTDKLIKTGRLECIVKTVSAPGLYHLGDVYVYPTRLEGIGLTIAEALASGLPVITCDHPPMNELVAEESGRLARVSRLCARVDGYYWPQCLVDEEDLCSQMRFYCRQPDRLGQLKSAARCYAEQHLNWQSNAAHLSPIFETCRRLPAARRRIADDLIHQNIDETRHLQAALSRRLPNIYRILTAAVHVAKRLLNGDS